MASSVRQNLPREVQASIQASTSCALVPTLGGVIHITKEIGERITELLVGILGDGAGWHLPRVAVGGTLGPLV